MNIVKDLNISINNEYLPVEEEALKDTDISKGHVLGAIQRYKRHPSIMDIKRRAHSRLKMSHMMTL